MNPALMILGPVILISLLWIIAESQARGGRLGDWYDQLFGRGQAHGGSHSSGGEEEPGRDAPIQRAPGSSRIYSWGEDHDLCVELFRAELNLIPEAEEPVR